MKRWLGLLLLPLLAHAGEPRIRLLSEPQGRLAPGQSLELRVQLLVPSYFLAAPQFPELSLDDGSSAQPGESLNLNLRLDGEQYAGIQRSYRFAPLPTGHYRLRGQDLTLRYADAQNRPREARLSLPPLTIEVASEGASQRPIEQNEPQLRISERLLPADAVLHSGDILLRELRIELYDAGSLLPPAPDIAEAAGSRLYRGAPQLSQDQQRGARLSIRTEQLRYLLLAPGELELPAVRLQWRDTRDGHLQQAELPARRLQVLPRPEQRTGASDQWAWQLVLPVILLVLAWFVLRGPWLRGWRQRRRYWRTLRQAARRNDALATERALETWLASLPAPRRLQANTLLHDEISALLQARYAANTCNWQGAVLLRQLARLRRLPPASGNRSTALRLNP